MKHEAVQHQFDFQDLVPGSLRNHQPKCLICGRDCHGSYCDYHQEIRDDGYEAMREMEAEYERRTEP